MEEAMERNPLSTQESLPRDNFTPLETKDGDADSDEN
jgi:hypothetical protein